MTGYKLGRILGIEVHIHRSWVIIGALVLWTLAANALPADYPRMAPSLRLVMAAVITLLFFASLLAHELAHSVVAMARGIPVHRITFFLFGGMAQTSTDSRSAGEEFLIAIAGPLMSFLLGGLFLAFWAVGANGGWGEVVVGTAAYVAFLNLILGTFNLLPGFPMDGGRVLRSVIWKITGNVTRATRWAARVGSLMAILLMAYGFYEILAGAFINGVWLIFIGMFIRNAARSSYRHHLVSRVQEVTQEAWQRHRHEHRYGPVRPAGPGAGGGSRPGPGPDPVREPARDDWPPPGRDVTPLSSDG